MAINIIDGNEELLSTLTVDPEFEGKIPPLTDDEFNYLRENILDAGEVYEPIKAWNGTVVDGHNRLKIIRENPDLLWAVREMEFPDRWAALEWMYKNQLGRRNLTDEQRTYMIGMMREARKNSVGKHRGNQYTKMELHQNGAIPSRGTSGAIARELGIGTSTVERAAQYARGIDAIREVSPEAADKLLSGKSRLAKACVEAIGMMKDGAQREAVRKAVEYIEDPEHNAQKPKVPKNVQPKKRKSKDDAYLPTFTPLSDDPYDAPDSGYGIDDFIDEINQNGEDYVRGLRVHIETMFGPFDNKDGRFRLRNAIGVIINNFEGLREEYE